jgi:hypothetical protein
MNESHHETLTQLSKDLKLHKVNKKTAFEVLKHLIEKSNIEHIRRDSIHLLMELHLKTPSVFEILEKCLLSDESPNVRAICAKWLLFDYPKKCRESIRWAIEHETSPYVLKTIKDLSFGMDGHKLELLR